MISVPLPGLRTVCELNVAQVIEIRERFAAGGVNQQALCEEYRVSKSAIWYVARRGSWGHV